MGTVGKVFRTLSLMLHALLPERPSCLPVAREGDAHLCAPQQVRAPLERLLDGRGELRMLFPGCLPIAAPLLLFRLKRRGFSSDAVMAIKRAYKTLYKSGLSLEQAKEAILEQADTHPELHALADFLNRTERGIIR